ncbi:MAG: PHP domain-containing protein [Bacilli bacterium]|nr:PHP domain-containing protein [Bacilli bacterium]MDD4076749.1 PHP domain-containing protein [Bacilli bacterium]MDD4388565.1 PHP domain-containing protein [Bacilli bacterium]
MKGDFHIHTVHSDGVYTVTEIIKLAQNLDYIAITDHDTFSGAKEAIKHPSQLRIIFGVELSTDYYGESVHLLGYFPNPKTTDILEARLIKQQQHRIERAYAIRDRLRSFFNIDFDFDMIKNSDSITRGSIARAIIAEGYPYSRIEIFDKMIGIGRPAYIPSTKLTTEEGIRLIKKCKGLVFLAHPVLLKKTKPEAIIALGIDGIEAIYPANNNADEEKYRGLAHRYGLLVSGGSDFHDFDDGMHGVIGETYLSGNDLLDFIRKMDEFK